MDTLRSYTLFHHRRTNPKSGPLLTHMMPAPSSWPGSLGCHGSDGAFAPSRFACPLCQCVRTHVIPRFRGFSSFDCPVLRGRKGASLSRFRAGRPQILAGREHCPSSDVFNSVCNLLRFGKLGGLPETLYLARIVVLFPITRKVDLTSGVPLGGMQSYHGRQWALRQTGNASAGGMIPERNGLAHCQPGPRGIGLETTLVQQDNRL